eukprot:scaffold107025_cov75-Phaeocystis_antarctica.AAC.1
MHVPQRASRDAAKQLTVVVRLVSWGRGQCVESDGVGGGGGGGCTEDRSHGVKLRLVAQGAYVGHP